MGHPQSRIPTRKSRPFPLPRGIYKGNKQRSNEEGPPPPPYIKKERGLGLVKPRGNGNPDPHPAGVRGARCEREMSVMMGGAWCRHRFRVIAMRDKHPLRETKLQFVQHPQSPDPRSHNPTRKSSFFHFQEDLQRFRVCYWFTPWTSCFFFSWGVIKSRGPPTPGLDSADPENKKKTMSG